MKVKEHVKNYFKQCIDQKSSDLFILPKDDQYQILFKKGDAYQKSDLINTELTTQIISFIKYLANMSISEHRRPQSGAFKWDKFDTPINIRISTVGDFLGRESMVVRFIYPLELTNEYVDQMGWRQVSELLKRRGLIVFAGPMGSGKTTSIYKFAKTLSDSKLVMSIEDPVEILEQQFLQIQVNEEAGMSYQNLLKAGLRHRPDVFIIGEIRDQQTAQIAVQAALSGHLVLTTIHAQNTKGVFERLLQLGVEEHFLKQAVNCVIYQRLIPLIDNKKYLLMDVEGNGADSGDWASKLARLRDDGQISDEVFLQYQYG